MNQRGLFLVLALAFINFHEAGFARAQDNRAGIEFFEKKIRPVLIEHCYQCHSDDAKKSNKLKAKLFLDSSAMLLKGGESGPAVVPGKAGEGTLLKALRHAGDIKMPPKGKLPETVLADFETWVKAGAAMPEAAKSAPVAKETDWNKARQFWAFQPPVKSPAPKVNDTAWPLKEIDRFILAELEKRQLKPVGPAGKRELLRRATFDLTGLPPTPEEMDEFLKDESPAAYSKVVERLLASPHHGERWARYWLDISRYAEDKALAFVNTRPHAYRYRDWVVQALNNDMPYDRFLKLQLAGDLLAEPEPDAFVKMAGLGFQGLGAEYHRGSVAPQVMADELDDRVDTLTRGLLGLTVACARCHDHKYDPIPTRDYYSLAAAYNGADLVEKPLVETSVFEKFKAWEKQTKEADEKLNQWLKEQAREVAKPAVNDAGKYLLTAWQVQVSRRNKLTPDLAAVAKGESLNPLFLERVVNFLEQGKFDKLDPALMSWITAAKKASETARVEQNKVIVPDVLKQATEVLQGAIRSALPQAAAKEPPSLLKALWLNPNTLFFVSDKELTPLLSDAAQKELAQRKADIERLKKEAVPVPPMGHVIAGGGAAMRINIRGNVERLGEPAPPGFLRVLSSSANGPAGKFTRLELANVIASSKNPLTARVIVNRVWHYHFGRGIVGTTSNFGALGDRPTHPELLDTLAVRFMESGWSLRWLHREIMLSRAYQLSGTGSPSNAERDPENQYLWRHTPQRLDFESWRDSWLAVSGRLDRTRGGLSLDLNQADNVRRTLYAKISRVQPNALLVLFDFPDANVTSDRRSVTTVPQQQLFALNSDFTIGTAKAFAKRLEAAAPKEEDRLALAFRLAYGRVPSKEEKIASEEFLREARAPKPTDRLTAWEQFAHAILASNEFQWVD
ncbi:PSD1 and planctomycete cytochrome C domain-containing protein [Zavarzinella formosa]|uniref:PSD1 and planctomycete cytochrome C domain-containing protein n=1 Tax=Zavarzinella formosa TaxID=360055 RepID=UPI0002D5D796|nr:PSD1 and planctomycete cytochrome C domain-containing protein [Zavarzinella formosa]